MNKEFIPYEQAVALKDLGFDEPCFGYLRKDSKKLFLCDFEINNDFIKIHDYKATVPLYQQAFRWFREKYGLHSYIDGAYPWFRYYINSEDNKWEGHKHLLFKEAELACLNKIIEIIKNKQL